MEMFLVIGAVVFVGYFFMKGSGRKARIKYWFQGYNQHMRENGGDSNESMRLLKEDFCNGKYGSNEYGMVTCIKLDSEFDLNQIIFSIIMVEFNILRHIERFPQDNFKMSDNVLREIEEVRNSLNIEE